MRLWLTLTVLALVVPTVSRAAASNINTSKVQRHAGEHHQEVQLIRCDVGNLAGDNPLGGELCEAGDWSDPVDCRDATNIGIRYFEYSAAGSSEVIIWDCLMVPGSTPNTSTGGGTIPGVEAPGGTPSAADPDPLCVDVTAAASVTLNGTAAGVQMLNLSNQKFHYLIGEIEACTDCESTLVVSCGR